MSSIEESSSSEEESNVCEMCNENKIDDSGVYVTEWLHFVDPHCDGCHAKVCDFCLITCLDCFNNGDSADIYCENCVGDDVKTVDCEYHRWYSCKKHKTQECGECRANRNYDLKHQM
jgi:hypothetical protein